MRVRYVLAMCVLVSAVGSVGGAEFQVPAEGSSSLKGDVIGVFQPPFESHVITHESAPSDMVTNGRFTITEALGGAFVGDPGMADPGGAPVAWTSGEDTDFIKYEIDVPETGDWYVWVRAIAPSQRDNSYYWAFDIEDADAISADTGNMNILDMYDGVLGPWTTDWVWFPFTSRTGPFGGGEQLQWTDDRVGRHFDAGMHTLHFTPREPAYLDHIWATTIRTQDPNVDPPTAVEREGKLATTWGGLKRSVGP